MGKAHSKLNPEAVATLQKNTHFDKKEIQVWYQAFLGDCPTGVLSKERFLQMYDNFFPFGDSTAFAGHMFRVYTTISQCCGPANDSTRTRSSSTTGTSVPTDGANGQPSRTNAGQTKIKTAPDAAQRERDSASTPPSLPSQTSISFEEYLQTLSVIARGRAEEKLRLAFALYDHDGDGLIGHADMVIIVDAIYRMVGALVEFAPDEETPRQRVDKMFSLFGKEENEKITFEEFQEKLQADPVAIKNLLIYDGAV